MKQSTKFLLVLASGIALTGCGKSPEATVEAFYTALGKGEITEAISYLSKQIITNFGEEKVRGGMTKESQRIAECGGIKSITTQLKGEGEIRIGQSTVTYGDSNKCPTKNEKTALTKEDGAWKISLDK